MFETDGLSVTFWLNHKQQGSEYKRQAVPGRWALGPLETLNLLFLNVAEKLESLRIKVPRFTTAFCPKLAPTNKPKVSQCQHQNRAFSPVLSPGRRTVENEKCQGEQMSSAELRLNLLISQKKTIWKIKTNNTCWKETA